MKISKEIKDKVKAIVADSDRSIDGRIESLFALRENQPKEEALEINLEIYRASIDLIKDEKAEATHIRDLMQLYVLLAETYDKMDFYPPLDDLSFEVREVLRDERIAWEVVEETLPRFIDVLKESVFHHETYCMLLVYLERAFKEGELSEDMKGYARHLLKLRILLDDCRWGGYMFTKDFQDALASLFSSEDLLKIILNPAIGHLKADPVEYTMEWEKIYYEVEKKLDERFANAPRHMGFCFRYWSAKQELLKDEYGIDWRSPAQMNPRVMFD